MFREAVVSMAGAIARAVRDGETVAVGTLSPIPAAGCLLARATRTPNITLAMLDDKRQASVGGSKEFFDFAQRGKLDLFFLSGIQIDAEANINLSVVGDYAAPKVRLPGGAGSGMLYYWAKRVILFKHDHTPRAFPERVDFITSPGHPSPGVRRPGGPALVVTPLCVMQYDRDAARLRLASVHPGHTVEEVQAATGFDLGATADVPETAGLSAEEQAALDGPVREHLLHAYPEFVTAVWGETTHA